MKTLMMIIAFLVLSFSAFAAPQENSFTLEVGRASGVDRQWIQNLARSCKVIVTNVDTESGFLTKTFYINYKGEYQNSMCFYEALRDAIEASNANY